MIDEFKLAINIILAIYSLIVLITFWFTWRKRPDLLNWFIALIIYTVGHYLLIFKQHNDIFLYFGNGLHLVALLIVIIATFIEYYRIFLTNQKEQDLKRKEKLFFYLTFLIATFLAIITNAALYFFSQLDLITAIMVWMMVLLLPETIFVMRIYLKQKTITRLVMAFVFLAGILTALSTIFRIHFIWGEAFNYAMNFIFITLIFSEGLAAPIEQRLTTSEEKFRLLSEHLEEKVAERTKQLAQANEELKRFSYSVSHDLRAPLRSILGFSEILKEKCDKKLDPEGVEFLERIIKSSKRMNQLITDLLSLSRISRNEMRVKEVNLSQLVADVFTILKTIYPDKEIECKIQEGITAQCDPTLIRVVLENLIANALKFSKNKQYPKITFGMKEQDNKRIFFVQDNGVGFNMKYYDKLFGLFQRLHSEQEFEGTGIGLITVKRIIERHNGEVWAEGEVGKGATFYFTLPPRNLNEKQKESENN
ncbi:MAG: GHKL domain-containing protein [Candidatus Heimdallarchaeota archaeon]|nr:GHKL domain-containing protein [Candidatus Heimdallarchaeota archaeon]